jgi:hypothetical protein
MTFFKTGAGDFQDRPGALHSTKKLWKNEKKKYIYIWIAILQWNTGDNCKNLPMSKQGLPEQQNNYIVLDYKPKNKINIHAHTNKYTCVNIYMHMNKQVSECKERQLFCRQVLEIVYGQLAAYLSSIHLGVGCT